MNLTYATVGRSSLAHIVKTNGKTYCGRAYSTIIDGKVSQVCQRCMTNEGKANIGDVIVAAEAPAEAVSLDTIMSTVHYGSLITGVLCEERTIKADGASNDISDVNCPDCLADDKSPVHVGDVVLVDGFPAEVMSVYGNTAHVAFTSGTTTYGVYLADLGLDISAETVETFNTDCVVLAYNDDATSAEVNRGARALARMRGMGAINAGQRADLAYEINTRPMLAVLSGPMTVSDSTRIENDRKCAPAVTSGSLATDVITMARNAIKALTPIRIAAESAFIAARDNGTDDYVTGWAYQTFADTRNTIEEYERTISSIAGEHSCMNHYSEIALTEECAYGCKIYRCGKCQDEATLHNSTYGCKGL